MVQAHSKACRGSPYLARIGATLSSMTTSTLSTISTIETRSNSRPPGVSLLKMMLPSAARQAARRGADMPGV